MLPAVLVVVGFLVLLALGAAGWGVGFYNSLVAVRNQVDQAWANIDVLLKQRHDELVKLIEVVKGAKDFEQGTLEKVIAARNSYAGAGSRSEAVAGAQAEGLALKQLFALAEAYPDLKTNQNFQDLQHRISGLEESIADRRELYNEAVNVCNTRFQQFPGSLLAGGLGFYPRDYLKVDEADRADVAVKF
jgi:LemA protein